MNLLRRFLVAIIDGIRPSLGPSYVCIYHNHLSCGRYAKYMLLKKPLYFAIPMIGLRLASCNPLTAIGMRFYVKIKLIYNRFSNQ